MDIFARYSNGGKTLVPDVEHTTINLKSGDTVRVSYKAPNGQVHIIDVTAQHMVLIAAHDGTEKAILCRPGSISVVS